MTTEQKGNIIQFRTFTDELPYKNNITMQSAIYETITPKPIKPEKIKPVIIEVLPWQTLPEGYTDYRPLLQRDGLILYAWEIYDDEIRIVWMTANSKMYKYQAWVDNEKDLATLYPKSRYDIGRYNDPTSNKADFIIYAAPSGLSANTKAAFITKLKEAGSTVDFNYEFSLGRQKAERERAVLDKIENRQTERTLDSDQKEILDQYRKLDAEERSVLLNYMKDLLEKQKGETV